MDSIFDISTLSTNAGEKDPTAQALLPAAPVHIQHTTAQKRRSFAIVHIPSRARDSLIYGVGIA